MRRYEGKTALVTGAGGGGIGQAIATRLALEGAAVALVDKDWAAAEKAVAAIVEVGGRAFAVEGDVTDEAAVERVVEAALAGLKRLDILVNNAARALKGNLEQTGPADWEAELRGTLTGAYLVTRRVLPGMVARGRGAIVNTGSVNALVAVGNPGYSAAKAALLNYTRSLAVEYGRKGIRANMVSPGTVRTRSPSWTRRLEVDPDIFDKLARWYPVGRVGEPDDIAAAVAFLGADEAGFVNGANLVVDGGLTAGLPLMADEMALEAR